MDLTYVEKVCVGVGYGYGNLDVAETSLGPDGILHVREIDLLLMDIIFEMHSKWMLIRNPFRSKNVCERWSPTPLHGH